jgi:hypothetical protein
LKQAQKEAEQKKRGTLKNSQYTFLAANYQICAEKLEDQRARAAIKAQIEADKRERAEKAAREKALRDGQPLPTSSQPAVQPGATTAAAAASSGTAGKDFKETRLQIRLASGGAPLTTTLPSDAREWLCNLYCERLLDMR